MMKGIWHLWGRLQGTQGFRSLENRACSELHRSEWGENQWEYPEPQVYKGGKIKGDSAWALDGSSVYRGLTPIRECR